MEYLRVKSWSKFQHYKDRNPPWIKLHFELLSSRDWVMLDDAGKLLAVACMLIASRDGGFFPHDAEYIRRVSYISDVNFKPLIDCGFLQVASEAEHMLATARPETEKEAETEQRKNKRFENRKGNGHAKPKPTSGSAAVEEIIQGWHSSPEPLDA
jgi:hypothetical protein